MASGRSGQLVVTAAKDAALTSSHSRHVQQRSAATTEPAYFLQHRFEDTALVIFRQHVKRLKEISPGHYTLLPTSQSSTPSLHYIPGTELGPGRASPDLHTDLDLGSDKTSAASGVSASRADRSPASGSSEVRTSVKNNPESVSSEEQYPEHSGYEVEVNGVSSPKVFTPDVVTSAADTSSDSGSSLGSSAPDSDFDEVDPQAGAGAEPSFPASVEEAEDFHVLVKNVGDIRDSSGTHDVHFPIGVLQNGQTVKTLTVESGPVTTLPSALSESPSVDSALQSPSTSSSLKEPTTFHESASVRDPHSTNESHLFSEPLASGEQVSLKEDHSLSKPSSPTESLSLRELASPREHNSLTEPSSPREHHSLSESSSPREHHSLSESSSPREHHSLTEPSSPRGHHSLTEPSSPREHHSLTEPSSPTEHHSLSESSSPTEYHSLSESSSPREPLPLRDSPLSRQALSMPSTVDAELSAGSDEEVQITRL